MNQRRYQFADGSNYPIRESKESWLLLPTVEDREKGTARDPEHCALAQCAIRNGAKRAYIAGTVAYVVIVEKGEEVAIKFSVPVATRGAIKTYDESEGEVFPTEGFKLGPLYRHQTAEGKREWNATRTPEQRKWTGKKSKKQGGDTDGGRDLRTYRYLTGQVHTTADQG